MAQRLTSWASFQEGRWHHFLSLPGISAGRGFLEGAAPQARAVEAWPLPVTQAAPVRKGYAC